MKNLLVVFVNAVLIATATLLAADKKVQPKPTATTAIVPGGSAYVVCDPCNYTPPTTPGGSLAVCAPLPCDPTTNVIQWGPAPPELDLELSFPPAIRLDSKGVLHVKIGSYVTIGSHMVAVKRVEVEQ